jgi:hypothetical protein
MSSLHDSIIYSQAFLSSFLTILLILVRSIAFMALPLQQDPALQRGGLEQKEAQQTKKLPVLKRKEQLNTIIVDKNGQPDFLAINIFWDSLRSWYAPLQVHHANGKVTKHRKLKTKGIYRSAEKLAKVHGVSKETIRRKLAKLETLGLIQRSFEHKETVTTKSYNHRQIFVWKHTPHFFNPCGIEFSEVGLLKPQTNAKYVEETHNVIFGLQSQVTKGLEAQGGIHTPEDTKELREYSNKLEYRSNAQAHESKFLNNSNSDSSLSEFVETIDANTTTCWNVDTTVKAVSKKKFKSNLRKKPTTAERKASKAKVYKFNQYEELKSLADHYPLSAEDAYELQKRSGTAYNLNAMNEILLDMSRKPKESKHMFESKAMFMSYMTKAYKNEGRDVDKANSPTFRIMKRRPKAEVTEIITLAQREKYLNETENSAIYTRCDYTQYRARIAGQFPINLAYDLLTNMVKVKREEHVLKITMHKLIPLSENYVQLLLKHAKGIGGYAGVSEILIQQYSFT